MKVEEFDYHLPQELIAQYPVQPRDASRMMVLRRSEKSIEHRVFREIVDILDDSYILVLNDTKVIPARLFGIKRETGAKVEVFLSRRLSEDVWECLARPAKRLKKGTVVEFDGFCGEVKDVLDEGKRVLEFRPPKALSRLLPKVGAVPLPPYIRRPPSAWDASRYQTVFAKKEGSVAAPTAGLHFTPEILHSLKEKGVEIVYVTLHVGLGTFKPVKVDVVEEHKMEEEFVEVSEEAARRINRGRAEGKKVLACGTTVVRSLESAARDGMLRAFSGWTNLFIYPGYRFNVVDALLTNFHLPRSTLLMLVCAFAGREFIMEAYHEAIRQNYRFYSYGDCMLIL